MTTKKELEEQNKILTKAYKDIELAYASYKFSALCNIAAICLKYGKKIVVDKIIVDYVRNNYDKISLDINVGEKSTDYSVFIEDQEQKFE